MRLRSWRVFGWVLFLGALARPGLAAEWVSEGSVWRWRRGTAEASSPDSAAWRRADFDDRGWESGPAPFFYGENLSGTLLADMRNGYTCVYLRKTFVVADPGELSAVRLRALSDDGFVAWINGTPVVRFNMPDGEPPYTGTALGALSEPLPTEVYELPGFSGFLVPGTNVLAVQAFNSSLGGSSDFVFEASLEADLDDQAPRMESVQPQQGARVASLTQIEVGFTEPVEGVDAGDLRVGGVPATNLTEFASDRYVFEFARVPRGAVSVEWAAGHGIRDRSSRRNPFAGGTWSYTVDPDLPPPGIQISEFMADNDRTLNDEDGDASDWIEIANTSEAAVNLSGWSLTDSASVPARWRFPAVSVPARGYLVVFASGKNRVNPAGRLHTNFRLGREGGYLALLRPDGAVASAFAPQYPAQQEDVSYGRLRTDPLKTGYFVVPTPGAANAEGGAGFGPEVAFSRVGGNFLEPFSLTLAAADPQATIRYTLDGSLPGEGSPAYTGPVPITASTRVRARTFVPGLLPGPVAAEYYVQLNATAATATSTLPLVVLHSFGRGSVPANGEYPAFVAIYEPRGGVASLTNAPDLRTRARLNIRGSSTLGQSKRNYSVEFRDERDEDLALEPLGMPAESDWVLYAPNNFEPILIHNPMAFAMSREIGRYAPRTRFVEVYVQTGAGAVASGNYVGIYVLMERIKRDPERVAIDSLEPEHLTEPAISGGYLLKVDRLDPGDGGLYAGGQVMGFVDPKEEELNLPQRAPQRAWIQNYLDRFGQALYAANWRDPVRGWRAYVDEDSWIDHHLINVVAFNVDALRLSAYFYKPRSGKLEFGPVWDFDRALNSTDGRDANPKVWRSAVSDMGTDFFNYTWWGRMFEDPDFWQRYIDRYQALRQGAFSTNRLFALVDELTSEVRPAQPREVARWGAFTAPRGSYDLEITRIKGWLAQRLFFMDTNFLAAPSIAPAGGTLPAPAAVTLSGPAGATLYYTLDGTDPRAPGGAVSASARAYEAPIPLTPGVAATVRARAFKASHRNLTGPDRPPISSSWSGPVSARYPSVAPPEPGALRVTEIHFRPAAPSVSELAVLPLAGRSDFEFLELLNTGSSAVDLHGARFTRGIGFDFSTSSVPVLAAGARLVLVKNRVAFQARYGALPPGLAGEFTGNLSGAGEGLRLEDASGRVLLDLDFRDGWQPAADGLGFSLVALSEGGPWTGGAADWRPSAAPGGSPGAVDPAPPAVPEVVVNEILSHTDLPQLDGVELFNRSSVPADLGGWYLTDDRSEPRKYRFPEGTVLPPGAYRWVDESAFNADPAGSAGFRLDSTGDAVWLFAARPNGELLGYADGTDFGAAANGVSFGRERLCDGTERFLAQRAVTPGAVNAGPVRPAVVISEIHYRPPDLVLGTVPVNDTALEFVELAVPGSSPVALYDPLHPENAWRLAGAVEFTFPPATTLPAGGRALVVNFDPTTNPQARATFLANFPNVPPGTPMFGPFAGSLPNGGGRLELVDPDPPQGPDDPQPGFVPYRLVDGIAYADAAPWPAAADGTGLSLQRPELEETGDRPGAWVAAAPSPGAAPAATLDSDADGMPDAWEVGHCLNPSAAGDALEDPDGDGAANRAEAVAATDPRDAGDVLRWSGVGYSGSSAELRFPAKAGPSYRVEVSEGGPLGPWRTLVAVGVRAEPGPVVVRDEGAGTAAGGRFYRLVVDARP